MDMKKMKIVFILSTVMMFVSSIVSAMAVSAYLYNSNEVSYNNNASGINSTNVQGAIDELYEHATDYTSMNTRVTALEGKFVGNPNITFTKENNYNSVNVYTEPNKDAGFTVFDTNNKRRGYLYYGTGDDATYLASYDSSGTWGAGILNLRGNPVKINGLDVSTKYTTAITPTVGTGNINLFSRGSTVTILFVNYNPGTLSARTTVATIPAGYRPPGEVYCLNDSNYNQKVGITANGAIWVELSLSNKAFYASCSYVKWQ